VGFEPTTHSVGLLFGKSLKPPSQVEQYSIIRESETSTTIVLYRNTQQDLLSIIIFC
jgi:hypothetical protein